MKTKLITNKKLYTISLNLHLTELEYNAVQVALDHLSEHLKESLDDSQLNDDERSDLEEKRSATLTAKNKFDISNTCIVDECENVVVNDNKLCHNCYDDATRFGEEYNQLPNLLGESKEKG
jgi:FKBP-type peptidyl-prolyl cis-trans isomerase (trigger factor)